MSQRLLLIAGIVALAASLLVGAAGVALNQGSLFGSSRGRTTSMDRAQASVQAFLGRRGDQDLGIDELMEFDQNFYALIKEKDTGIGAFELRSTRAPLRSASSQTLFFCSRGCKAEFMVDPETFVAPARAAQPTEVHQA